MICQFFYLDFGFFFLAELINKVESLLSGRASFHRVPMPS